MSPWPGILCRLSRGFLADSPQAASGELKPCLPAWWNDESWQASLLSVSSTQELAELPHNEKLVFCTQTWRASFHQGAVWSEVQTRNSREHLENLHSTFLGASFVCVLFKKITQSLFRSYSHQRPIQKQFDVKKEDTSQNASHEILNNQCKTCSSLCIRSCVLRKLDFTWM